MYSDQVKCDNCGKSIKRVYIWCSKRLGIECYRKLNPFYQDPAQAVYVAAQAILEGDNKPANLLPAPWPQTLKTSKVQNYAWNLAGLTDGDDRRKIYWLAVS